MQDTLREIIKDGLAGKHTHINPITALKDLTPEIARKKSETHSCWGLLHHIVLWQDAIIEAINGKKIEWKEIEKNNWPSEDRMQDDKEFYELVSKFEKKFAEITVMLDSIDLHKPMPAWKGFPAIRGFFVLLQHNSYHIGQLITTRKMLGSLPEKF